MKKYVWILVLLIMTMFLSSQAYARDRESARQEEIKAQSEQFSWWPTDAQPAPKKDEDKGGWWWWPKEPGTVGPLWGNRGFIYVSKIIYDYQADDLPAPKPQELRPSLIIKNIRKNVKVYFDYNKSTIREDAADILKAAAGTLKRSPETDILVTGNCDTRGTESYNEKLGRKRAEAVRQFLTGQGIDESRIRIVSQGKLNAIAPVTDLIGMQKDRNAQFMIAEVEEVMIPYQGNAVSAGDALEDETERKTEPPQVLESAVRVDTKEYTVRKNDSLWSIAQKELGSGHRWKYLYEINKDRIRNPDKLKIGSRIVIPVE
ncbi:MAG: OmpA family protein [Candidatus Omnitrophota bacterium]